MRCSEYKAQILGFWKFPTRATNLSSKQYTPPDTCEFMQLCISDSALMDRFFDFSSIYTLQHSTLLWLMARD